MRNNQGDIACSVFGGIGIQGAVALKKISRRWDNHCRDEDRLFLKLRYKKNEIVTRLDQYQMCNRL